MDWQRIRSRHEIWWGKRKPLLARLHRLRELERVRDAAEPLAAWRCCELWPRALTNKLNARAFAAHHGCRLPAVLWMGRRPERIPLDALPRHYVIKPVVGAACGGVLAVSDGVELMCGARRTHADLRAQALAMHGRIARWPLVVEEFAGAGGALPLEYRCHVFGDTVAAIEVVRRHGPKSQEQTVYDSEWRMLPPPFRTIHPPGQALDRPPHLAELVRLASVLGTAIGTYMRADFYSTERGWVFGEFSSTPGGGDGFTEVAVELFERLWCEKFPDRS
ncbi:MAG: ATP-grasp fold amidoligase family protein [bacterium]